MSHKNSGWTFTSTDGSKIEFKTTDDTNEFSIFYEIEKDTGIIFDKKDIPDLINLLLEIQDA